MNAPIAQCGNGQHAYLIGTSWEGGAPCQCQAVYIHWQNMRHPAPEQGYITIVGLKPYEPVTDGEVKEERGGSH